MVETSYGQTFVRISGATDAQPLILLPGAAVSSLIWIPNIKALSASYRTYALDNIYDVGRSIYTRPLKGVDDCVNWLDELFDALELGSNINLMGLSLGGWLTGQYAIHFPDRLAKMVLLAPAATVLPMRAEFMIRFLLCLIPHPYFLKNFWFWLFKDLAHSDETGRSQVEEILDDMRVAAQCFAPKGIVSPTVLNDQELQSIKVPALYLVGENERIYSAQKAVQRLNEVAPHIKTEIISQAGHDLTFVQTEVVNGRVLEFLQQS